MVVAFGNAGAVGVLLQLLLVLPLLLFLLVLLLLLFSWCCCCWARGDDEGVGSVGAAPGVAAAAGMEEKMRSVWGSVDREGCFGCREEMAERGEWPGGGLFLGALSLSRSKNTPPLLVFQPPPVQQNSPRFKLLPLSVSKSFPPLSSLCLLSAVLGAIYRASGCGFCCCAWERVSRRLVGHWVLLSRFGSNGMERGG
jgi:hypothetical protein